MTDGRDDVTDRVASRFDADDESDESDSKKAMSAQNSQTEAEDKNAQSRKNAKNVKNAWNAKTIYLPDELHDDLGTAYKRLDLDLDNDFEELRKTRHFYPLLVAAGLERLESMEPKEVIERLESIDPDIEDYLSDKSI